LLWEVLAAVGFSWARITVAITLSMIAAIFVGIPAGRDRRLDRIVIPLLDVLQSVPILAFFPIAVYLIANAIPLIGYDVSSIFLIFTCTFWNLAFAAYEATRSIPSSILEVAEISKLPRATRLRVIYMPAVFPRLVDQIPASLANAFFFLSASEVITLGNVDVSVAGIGTLILDYFESARYDGVLLGLGVTVFSIAAVYVLIITPLLDYSSRYRFDVIRPPAISGPRIVGRIIRATSYTLSALKGEGRRGPQILHRFIPTPLVKVLYMRSDVARFITIVAFVTAVILAAPRILYGIDDAWLAIMRVWEAAIRIDLLRVGVALLYSFLRVIASLTLMLSAAIPLAYLLIELPRLRAALLPAIQIIASLPAPLFFPIISKLFVSTSITREVGALLLIAMGSYWYIHYSAISGFGSVHTDYIEIARLYNISRMGRLRYIYLPFATPTLVTGLITASGGAWNTLIVAERMGEGGRVFSVTSPGIGKMMTELAERADTFGLIFTVIVMTAFIVAFNRLVWRRLYDYAIKALRVHEQ